MKHTLLHIILKHNQQKRFQGKVLSISSAHDETPPTSVAHSRNIAWWQCPDTVGCLLAPGLCAWGPCSVVWVYREIKAKGNGSVVSVSEQSAVYSLLQETGTLAIAIIQIQL